MEIIPAIIGKNIKEIREKIEKVESHVKWVQIDIMDGVFSPNKSWPYTEGDFSELNEISSVRKEELQIEFHLMVKNPEDIIGKVVECGADRIVFHYESTNKAGEIIKQLEYEEIECGIALKLETNASVIEKYFPDIDTVLLMSIGEIGNYGQEFQEGIIEKIKNLKDQHPGLVISVDGGINIENIKSLKDAGVENFVIGSGIYKSENVSEAIKNFKKLIF